MSIRCQLCDREFPKIIPYQHLQKEHGMTGKDYAIQFGSTISEETRARQQARVPHNKGKKVTDPEILTRHREAVARREQRYQSGELCRGGHSHTDQTRQNISDGVREYAKNNQEKLSQRAKKASVTKKSRGYVSSGMQGKSHSAETREKIRASSAEAREKSREQSLLKRKKLLESFNVTVIDVNHKLIVCQCNSCDFQFTRTYTNSNWEKIANIELCPQCRSESPRHSHAELEIANWVQSQTNHPVVVGDRTTIAPLELDIFIPDLQLAIEYCGLYWHSEISGSKHHLYHQHKWQRCRDVGVNLITIFEDEWLAKKSLVQGLLRNRLGITDQKISARSCDIVALEASAARAFLEQNHIHGYAASNLRLGLMYQNQLAYVMTFARKNISRKNTHWEIQRMAGINGMLVRGAADRLFQKFLQQERPDQVISYADLRWFTGNSYGNLGFEPEAVTSPGYWYFQSPNTQRIHRFTMRKNANDDPQLTEWQNRQAQGWDRIWDCGHARWRWKRRDG